MKVEGTAVERSVQDIREDKMNVDEPRLAPLSHEEFKGELRAAARRFLSEEYCDLNLVRTLARSPEAMVAFLTWARYFLSTSNSLAPRDREIVILRVAFLTRSDYEISQHIPIGLAAGVTPDEFHRIKEGSVKGWSAAELALLQACDDLVANHVISAEAWRDLLGAFSERQAMDVIMTIAQYLQLAMILNSLKVQLEPGSSTELPRSSAPQATDR
jgi:4-carboxymuconolactone decarboxylase